jgi:hypothetical protein
MKRRRFIRNSATVATAWSLLPTLRAASAPGDNLPPHPRLFIAAEPNDAGLQSVFDFREAVQQGGFLTDAWNEILATAHAEKQLPPLQPDSAVPGRPANMIRDRNLDYFICYETGARLNRFSLVHLVTGDEACREAALAQLRAVFDPDQWPDWQDQAHAHFGHPAGLRTGMLAQDCAIAYDWLYPSLTEAERAEIREGIDRRGIQPFLTSIAQDPWWMTDLNNWVTVIAGGVAIAAMALWEHHPEADRIIAIATAKFDEYLATYGPKGEFNESPSYATANRIPVGYFNALRFATGGKVNRVGEFPFPEMCRWTMHATLDGARPVPFGDSRPNRPIMSGYVAAVAAATQDPVLQHFFLHTRSERDAHPINLLYYDARLKPLSPQGREPLAAVFPAHGGMIVSRTSWGQESTACIVFSKFGREEQHENNDLGMVGFDTFGERLVIDIGSPSAYPGDFFEHETRWNYYNTSVRGHNTLIFGGREQRYPVRERGEPIEVEHISGQLLHWSHQDGCGTAWRMDLTPAYEDIKSFKRTVIHLLPGYIAVLDEAALNRPEEISLRWHTIDQAAPTADGAFVVRQGAAAATGQITSLLDADLQFARREHRYVEPYHLERNGDPLVQHHESFIDTTHAAESCRLLTLFATGAAADFGGNVTWQHTPHGWVFAGPHGPVTVEVTRNTISAHMPSKPNPLVVPLA